MGVDEPGTGARRPSGPHELRSDWPGAGRQQPGRDDGGGATSPGPAGGCRAALGGRRSRGQRSASSWAIIPPIDSPTTVGVDPQPSSTARRRRRDRRSCTAGASAGSIRCPGCRCGPPGAAARARRHAGRPHQPDADHPLRSTTAGPAPPSCQLDRRVGAVARRPAAPARTASAGCRRPPPPPEAGLVEPASTDRSRRRRPAAGADVAIVTPTWSSRRDAGRAVGPTGRCGAACRSSCAAGRRRTRRRRDLVAGEVRSARAP